MVEYDFGKLRHKIHGYLGNNIFSEIFEKCFMNTIDTACTSDTDGSVFVVTGDIPAMWLRDSSAEVMQYLHFADDENVRNLLRGVLKRQFKYIQEDPYANAFMFNENFKSEWEGLVETDRLNKKVWERKFEPDSLCYPLFLAYKYFEATGDTSVFGSSFLLAFDVIINTFNTERKHSGKSSYFFKQCFENSFTGKDNNPESEKGLIWCAYRPSDDRCTFNYHIPDNMFIVSCMEKMGKIFTVLNDEKRFRECRSLADELVQLINTYGITQTEEYGRIYVSETDCMGHFNLSDDANIPSLLSLPYLEYPYLDEEIYLNTRKYILSKNNKYYFEGKILKGIGSPHTPGNRVWPLAVSMQGITSENEKEITDCFDMLVNTTAGSGFMHESIDADNESVYTRPWFAWANSLFADFVIRKREIILKHIGERKI